MFNINALKLLNFNLLYNLKQLNILKFNNIINQSNLLFFIKTIFKFKLKTIKIIILIID
ncbi:MAG: hypothetical protein ArsCj_4150 [Arsenophonus endosymbiont of Ceratovacuna japonica]